MNGRREGLIKSRRSGRSWGLFEGQVCDQEGDEEEEEEGVRGRKLACSSVAGAM